MKENRFFKKSILIILDFFYPLFKRWLSVEKFRHLSCGLSVSAIGLFTYAICYNFMLSHLAITNATQNPDSGLFHEIIFKTSPHTLAYLISVTICLPTGFMLSKFIVFEQSRLCSQLQFYRYVLLQLVNIPTNYFLLFFFVELCRFWPTPSLATSTVILSTFNYYFQRYVSFPRQV